MRPPGCCVVAATAHFCHDWPNINMLTGSTNLFILHQVELKCRMKRMLRYTLYMSTQIAVSWRAVRTPHNVDQDSGALCEEFPWGLFDDSRLSWPVTSLTWILPSRVWRVRFADHTTLMFQPHQANQNSSLNIFTRQPQLTASQWRFAVVSTVTSLRSELNAQIGPTISAAAPVTHNPVSWPLTGQPVKEHV